MLSRLSPSQLPSQGHADERPWCPFVVSVSFATELSDFVTFRTKIFRMLIRRLTHKGSPSSNCRYEQFRILNGGKFNIVARSLTWKCFSDVVVGPSSGHDEAPLPEGLSRDRTGEGVGGF